VTNGTEQTPAKVRKYSPELVWAFVRNAVPFGGMYWLGWSAQNAAWLAAFSFILQVSIIATAKFVAPKLRSAGTHRLIPYSLIFVVGCWLLTATVCMLGILFTSAGYLLEISWHDSVSSVGVSLRTWLAVLAVGAIPTFLAELRVEIERSRDKPYWHDVRFGEVVSITYALGTFSAGMIPLLVRTGNDTSILIGLALITAFSMIIAFRPEEIRDATGVPNKRPEAPEVTYTLFSDISSSQKKKR
jgi:hypothetical protein